MPPKTSAKTPGKTPDKTPAKTPAKSGAQSPEKQVKVDPKVQEEKQVELLKAIKLLAKEREKQSENVLLKRLKAKDRKAVVRAQKVVKFTAEQLPIATVAAIKIQSWMRMLKLYVPCRRQRNSIVGACRDRVQFGLSELGHSVEGLNENIILRQLPAHKSVLTLSKYVKTAKFQAAALQLQACSRAHRERRRFLQTQAAAAVLTPQMRRIAPQLEWETQLAELNLHKVYERALCQINFQERKQAISLLQAKCRRCVIEVISEQKRKKHQATFKRAYVNHKMWMMREIWTRRNAIIEIQSQIRYVCVLLFLAVCSDHTHTRQLTILCA